MKKVILVYSNENVTVANKLKTALSGRTTVESFEINNKNDLKSVSNTILNETASQVLLLISDNFLKSEACMNNAMYTVQTLGNQKRLIPITTDGVYRNVGGELTYIHTSFDRVSHVIQYMNFWQERYLQIRSQKTGNNDAENSDKTKLVRSISSEIGELLRYLRTMEYYPYEQFESTKFNFLYRLLEADFGTASNNEKQIEKPITTSVFPEQVYKLRNETGINEAIRETLSDNKPVFKAHSEVAMPHISEGTNGKSKIPTVFFDKSEPVVKKEQINFNPLKLTSETNVPKTEEKNQDSITNINKPPLTLEALIENIKKESLQEEHKEITSEPEKIQDSVVLVQLKNEPPVNIMKEVLAIEPEEIKQKTNVEPRSAAAIPIKTELKHIPENAEKQQDITSPIIKEKKEIPNDLSAPTLETTSPINKELSPSSTEEKTLAIQVPVIENSFNKESKTVKIINVDTKSEPEKVNIEKAEIPVLTNSTAPNIDVKNEKQSTSPLLDSELSILKAKLEKHTDDNNMRYQYASLLVENREFDNATEQLEIILQNNRKHVDSYILLAYIAEQNRDYGLSLNSLEKVMLLQPTYPGIFYKLGMLTQEHFPKQSKKALYYFKESLTSEPKNAAAYYAYANLLSQIGGNDEDVKANYERALEFNPSHANAHIELAKYYSRLDDKKSANLYYQKACVLDAQLKSKENDALFYYEEPKKIVYKDNGITVMITGATSGIGKAAATLFAQHGYRLILTGRRAERLSDIKSELQDAHSNKILTLAFDVRDLESVHKAIESLEKEWQNIDILLNNAGLASGLSPIYEGDVRGWEQMIDTNIKGLLYVTRAVTPGMVARRKGQIINICSTAGKEIYPNGNVYVATKHAVDALTRAMRLDLFKHNVRVGQVAPGMVEDTEFSLIRFNGDAEKAKIYEDIKPLNAGDIADAIYYIATRPEHVNIQDIVMMSVQQGSANHFDRSGRNDR